MQFKYVAPVHAGDPISSTSHNNLALAFNQRLLSGAGDACWRIIWNAHSLMRQVRNPSDPEFVAGTQQWPAADEWWKVYALVDNNTKCGNTGNSWYWPTNDPGTAEGANVVNPMMAFVFGRDYTLKDQRDLYDEAARLTDGPQDDPTLFTPIHTAVISNDPDSDALYTWTVAKLQRGWIEAQAPFRADAPAYEAAHSTYAWRYASGAPYLKVYPGFAPVARSEGRCPEYGGIYPVYWHAKFTPLVSGQPVLTFPTCPGVSGHIQYIARGTDSYVLYFQDAPPIALPYTLYIEGPYDGGGVLGRQHSEIMTQALNKFVVEMRGDLGERRQCYHVEDKAFDFQRFLSTQYAMSPAAGGVVTEDNVVTPGVYPTYLLSHGSTTGDELKTAGTTFALVGGHRPGDSTTAHKIAPNFVFSAIMVQSSGTLSNATLEFLDANSNPIHLGSPTSQCDSPDLLRYTVEVPASFDSGKCRVYFLGAPVSPGSVRVRLRSNVVMSVGGSISVEILEQVAYTPDVQDAYAVLRCGLTKGIPDGATEGDAVGQAINSEQLLQLSTNYFKYGCIINVNGRANIAAHHAGVNFNSIYESARQLINENMRMVPKERLLKYSVEGGKSVITFNRYAIKPDGDDIVEMRETEIKTITASQVVNPASVTVLKPLVEYVVRKDVNDNVKPIIIRNPSLGNRADLVGKYPLDVYRENGVVYCDDYVVYGNVKYVPPGYNTNLTPEIGEATAADTDSNYDHVIVGIPIPTYDAGEHVPEGYLRLVEDDSVKTFYNPTTTRTRVYTDGFGNSRSETINAAKIYWKSPTYTGVPETTDVGGIPASYTKDWTTVTMHNRIQSAGDADPGDSTAFRFNNGFRYVVQRRLRNEDDTDWLDWATMANGPSGDTSTLNNYGFSTKGDPATDQGNTGPGVYSFEDRAAYGLVQGTEVEYRILAKPTLDVNTDKMVVYQRAYFTPAQIQWTATPGVSYHIKRVQQLYGGTVEEVNVSGTILPQAGTRTFVDLPSSICPVHIHPDHLELRDQYQLRDSILRYRLYAVSGSTDILIRTYEMSEVYANAPTFVVRPDNIVPTETADLFGKGDPYLVDITGAPLKNSEIDGDVRPAGCFIYSGLKYKVYGPSSSTGVSGLGFIAPWFDSTDTLQEHQHDQIVRLYVDAQFGWDARNNFDVTSPCGAIPGCLDPWIPSKKNFREVEKIWKLNTGEVQSASTVSQQARVYQYALFSGDCDTLELIENTAGVEPGSYTGIFAFEPSNNSLADFRKIVMTNEPYFYGDILMTRSSDPGYWDTNSPYGALSYSSTIRLSQWTPWTPRSWGTDTATISTAINGNVCPWYVLRTGYERLHLEVLTCPTSGTFTVRGVGYLTYNGHKYYSGDLRTIPPAGPFNYTISDASMKIVIAESITCASDLFDFFAGIAPARDLSESELGVGVTYQVYGGTGLNYKLANGATVAYLPGDTFTWLQGNSNLVRNVAAKPSQVRALDGIVHQNAVAPKGSSNEWCMFMTFNHYHPSISSIWKTDNYGDISAFLHNRCHTMSAEIRAPQHTALVREFSYGIQPPFVSEAPPGYTYLEDINFPGFSDRNHAKNYFRSCSVYRQPYEIESVTNVYSPLGGVDDDGNPKMDDTLVKVTFKTRIQHTPEAPASINSPADLITGGDPLLGGGTLNPQNIGRLRAESYRTDENGIREYLTYSLGDYNCVKGMTGDSSTSFDLFSLPDDPFGACHPRCYFVKLIPYVYKGAGTVNNDTSPLIRMDPYLQMDLYLRAMCGGWMDIDSLRQVNCDQGNSTSPVADYLYTNLCYQACRSYGGYLPVTPEILSDLTFLPLQTIAQYDFVYDSELIGKQLVLEYRTWEMDKCAFGPWARLEGEVTGGNTIPPVGGTGYSTPPVVTVNAGPSDSFRYVALGSPVTLTAGEQYYLVTNETSGGDQWRTYTYIDSGTHDTVNTLTGISSVLPATYVGGVWSTVAGHPDTMYGPVDFKTSCVGCTTTSRVFPSDPFGTKRNNITGKIGMQFTADSNLIVYELGRWLVAGNTGTHTVELISVATGTVLASVSIDTQSGLLTPDVPGSYSAPTMEAVVSGGSIVAINVPLSGYGYDNTKLSKIKVNIQSAAGSGAQAVVSALWEPGDDFVSGTEETGIKTISISNGGSGYVTPVQVQFVNENFLDPLNNRPASAVATIGGLELSSIAVSAGGSGYTTASVTISGTGGSGAAAVATVTSGQVTAINVTNKGSGYIDTPDILITGDGDGAIGHALMTPSGSTTGPIRAITVTNPDNFGYASAPDVLITGGGGTGAYGVARMTVIDLDDGFSGMAINGVDLVPAPTGALTTVSLPVNGPTFVPSQFRFTYATDWENGTLSDTATFLTGVSITPSVKLSFNFLPDNEANPHKYRIDRNDYKFGNGCVISSTWHTVTSPAGESGPECDANKGHTQYDDCTTDCACLWTDPNTATPSNVVPIIGDLPLSTDIIGSSYRIKDLSAISGTGAVTSIGVVTPGSNYADSTQVFVGGGGVSITQVATATATVSGGHITAINITNPGSGYTQSPYIVLYDPTGAGSGATASSVINPALRSYYLTWPMQSGVVYNVERKMHYRYDTAADWTVVAQNVRSPYVDTSSWSQTFERTLVGDFTYNYLSTGVPVEIAAVDSASVEPRVVSITATKTNKNVYLQCVVTLTVPIEGGDPELVDYPVDELKFYVDSSTSISVTDDRLFPDWDGTIVKFTYTTREVSSANINWTNLPNHARLVAEKERNGLVYSVHRKYETQNGSGGYVAVDEVIAQSVASGDSVPPNWVLNESSQETLLWLGWDDEDHRRLDDQRNNNFVDDVKHSYINTETYYVTANWHDFPEVTCLKNAQQNRTACTPADDTVPCVLIDREYRVEAITNVRSRWMTSMPIAINVNRPQGFSPVPNTCTYTEMFNNFAAAINKLVYCRLELPFTKKMRRASGTSIPPNFLALGALSCKGMGCLASGHKLGVCPSGAPYVTWTQWDDVPVNTSASAYIAVGPSGYTLTSDCVGGQVMMTNTGSTEFAVDPDQECFAAIPPSLMSNFNISNLALIGKRVDTASRATLSHVATSCAASSCCPPYSQGEGCDCFDYVGGPTYSASGCGCGCRLHHEGDYMRVDNKVLYTTKEKCTIFLAGTITAPPCPCGDTGWIGGSSFDGPFMCPLGGASSSSSVSGIRSLIYMTFPVY